MIENPARIASKLRIFSARPGPVRPGSKKIRPEPGPARPASGPARLTPLVNTKYCIYSKCIDRYEKFVLI